MYLPAALIYCQMTQLMQMCLIYYLTVEKNVETNSKLPSVFHQHCLSPFSGKQLSLCQFSVGLPSAHFMHCIYLLSLL